RELKELFLRYSQERRQFAAELQNAVRMAGGEPESRGSVSGVLHRGWMSVKSAFTGGGPGAGVHAAGAGEDSAGQAYRKALGNDDLPADLRALVERQFLRIQEAHDRIRALRDRRAA